MDNTQDSLNNLRLALLRQHPMETGIIGYRKGTRLFLTSKIENIVLKLIGSIAKDEAPYFLSINFGKPSNYQFNERLQLKDPDVYKKKKISFSAKSSRSRFAIIVFLLSKIHKLLMSCKTSTRRELYYRNLDVFKTQSEVDKAIADICYIVDAPSWELGVTSTAKGVVAGPLILKFNDDVICCDKPGGVLIPQNVLQFELISRSIQWVLIVEKDAAFQNILDGNGLSKLNNCLFVTAKGYPDVNTRLLVCRLWECFKVPILVLVDADPYGIEIMCVYRFGSMNSSLFSDRLACPSVRWLGIHPSDIKLLGIQYKNLAEMDTRRLSHLISRSYVRENERIRKEIQILVDENIKAEIEDVSRVSSNYLVEVYIPSKIRCQEYF